MRNDLLSLAQPRSPVALGNVLSLGTERTQNRHCVPVNDLQQRRGSAQVVRRYEAAKNVGFSANEQHLDLLVPQMVVEALIVEEAVVRHVVLVKQLLEDFRGGWS
jgi:hypothetical protein